MTVHHEKVHVVSPAKSKGKLNYSHRNISLYNSRIEKVVDESCAHEAEY